MLMHRRSCHLVLLAVALLAFPVSAIAGTVTITASADTYVDNGQSATNFGSATRVVTDASPTNNGYLRFSVPALSGAVASAKVRLTVGSDIYDGTPDGPAIYPTTSGWTEAGLTWSNQPSATGGALADVGSLAVNGVATFDVSSAVTGSGDVSFVLKQPGTDGARFLSREATSGRPQLVITTVDGGGGVDTIAPTAPAGLTATTGSSSSIILSWGAAYDAVGVSSYAVYRGGTPVATVAAPATTFTDTGLAAASSFSYTVRARDAAGNTSPDSTTATATTSAAAPAGTITVAASADSYVDKGRATTNYGSATRIVTDGNPVNNVFVRFAVPPLAGRVTSAQVRMTVGSGTDDGTIDGPAIYLTTGTWTEGGLTWNNQPSSVGSALADIGRSSAGSVATFDVTSAVTGAGDVSFVLKQPNSDGTRFLSREAASGRPQLVITTIEGSGGGGDTVAPTAPTGLTASPASSTSIDLSWGAASDDVGVSSYIVYRGVTQVATVAAPVTTYTDTGLAPSTSYSYVVRATDAAGNAGPASNDASATTSAQSMTDWTVPSGSFVLATAETTPVPHSGDAADDPAIWVNVADPAASRVIGTDKLGGLAVYDLSGTQVQYLAGGLPVNVDLRDGFALGGSTFTLVTATDRSNNTLVALKLDATGVLTRLAAFPLPTEPYGTCMYRSPVNGSVYTFVDNKAGVVDQWELKDTNGTLTATRVRSFDVGTQVEGCVADDENARFYIGEEDVAVWRYGAEPGAGTARTAVGRVGDGNLTADIEGLTLTYASGGRGHLIVSSQGSNSFTLYRRDTNAWASNFRTEVGAVVDGCEESDGVDATAVALGAAFPSGLLVCQDGFNAGASTQDFKLISLDRVVRYAPPA